MNASISIKNEKVDLTRATSLCPVTLSRAVVRQKAFGPGEHVLRQGDEPKSAHVLLEGCTYHYRILADGRRQITALQVPGDVCDLAAVMHGRAAYNVVASTDCVVGEIPAASITDPGASDVRSGGLLWRPLLREDAIAREWLVGLGRRDALARVAHLMCEIRVRLENVGLALGCTAFRFCFTQAELADSVGLSTIHVNRVLQSLRRSGLIRSTRGGLAILDIPALETVAGFDPTYLRAA